MRIDESLKSYELECEKERARYRQIIAKSHLITKHSLIIIVACVSTLTAVIFLNMIKNKK